MLTKFLLCCPLLLMAIHPAFSQDTIVYHLTIDQEKVTIADRKTEGMTVNGAIPGPTLRFTEGDYAEIYVTNQMNVETSVHWHGLLLPNFFDGVPYLTTPPIAPGQSLKYEFPIKQSGTYWYHSHTMLQEQRGVYGSIVIAPKTPSLVYDQDLVIVLSDWTNEKPEHVMKNLKRGLEWYNIKKGTATPLNRVIAQGGLGAQINFWKQRMEGADIADIYYPAFLTNGAPTQEYSQFKPGEKVRVRFINAAASSQFWLTFGGEDPTLVSADGLDVVPVKRNKTFIAIAETYDFIVTVPPHGKVEIRAMAQDGSGHTSAYLGQGALLAAPHIPRPDKIAMMKKMAAMKMKMGAPAMKFNPHKVDPHKLMDQWGMEMEEGTKMDHSTMKGNESENQASMSGMPMEHDNRPSKSTDHTQMNHSMPVDSTKKQPGMHTMETNEHSRSSMQDTSEAKTGMPGMDMSSMDMFAEYNYEYLRSSEKTSFAEDKPVKEIILNLTGNMWRYVWSMNGVPLNETDQIKIKEGEVTRIVLNNLTMMHHPMHLHGHFFRVINKNGEYSPLKHTVNVPPMQKVVIEFYGNEYGDWFFHCHVLYHMNGGMARIFSYDTKRDQRLLDHPLINLVNEANHLFTWGIIDIASHMTELNLVASNIRNQFTLSAEYGWNQNTEAEFTYERYLYDYFRVFGGVNVENERRDHLGDLSPTAIVGIRYFTPYMMNLDVRVDSKLRPEVRVSREMMVFPRTFIFGTYEYQANFGWVELPLDPEDPSRRMTYQGETTWSAGIEYLFSKNFSVMGSYDNRFGAGGGLSIRF